MTLNERIAALPDGGARLSLEPTVYEEQVFSEKRELTVEGDSSGGSELLWHYGAHEILEDGIKRGTFRTYTAFFGGERLILKDITIKNDAGEGRLVGQSVAAYLDSARVYAENCTFDSHQDTLFLSPLPDAEREPGGFRGPREHSPRLLTKQYFKSCKIIGDVDFIFGGADAVFDDCEIICRNAGSAWVSAPCGHKENLGLVFRRCKIGVEDGTPAGSAFLGRPWRPEGRAIFLSCETADEISPLRFSGWGAPDAREEDTFMAEYGTLKPTGEAVDLSKRNPWVKALTKGEADEINDLADKLISEVTV